MQQKRHVVARDVQIALVHLRYPGQRIQVLNVAGPRESSSPGIHAAAVVFLRKLIQGADLVLIHRGSGDPRRTKQLGPYQVEALIDPAEEGAGTVYRVRIAHDAGVDLNAGTFASLLRGPHIMRSVGRCVRIAQHRTSGRGRGAEEGEERTAVHGFSFYAITSSAKM